MPFLTELKVRKVLGKNEWFLLEPLAYKYCDLTIVVPPGFWTDFASVPRLPFLYLTLGNIGHEAAVIHDYLYRIDSVPVVEKDFADKMFYYGLQDMDISEIQCRLLYDGVVVGGQTSYHKRYINYKGE